MRHKPLKTNGKSLVTQLIQQTKKVARQTGLPVFHIGSNQQKGANFGERFANAIEQVFNRGFERVIAVGNDCPALQTADLLQAAALLQHHDYVFGPATDGGVYLLGLHRKVYQRAPFVHVRWQTSWVLTDLLAMTRQDAALLSVKRDIDQFGDIPQVCRAVQGNPLLRQFLLHLLQAVPCRVPVLASPVSCRGFFRQNSLRGPPAPVGA
jgi:uncharacterized protein